MQELDIRQFEKVKIGSKKKNIYHICTACCTFFDETLPGQDKTAVIDELIADEEFSTDIMQASGLFEPPENPDGNHMLVTGKKRMEITCHIEESYPLRTHRQVIKKSKKTPKNMKMRPMTWFDKAGKKELLYPGESDVLEKRLVVRTTLRDIVDTGYGPRKHHFKSQARHLLKLMRFPHAVGDRPDVVPQVAIRQRAAGSRG